jgi:hypothetical protein
MVDIDEVHARRGNTHAELARSRLRRGQVLDLHDLGPAGLMNANDLHDSSDLNAPDRLEQLWRCGEPRSRRRASCGILLMGMATIAPKVPPCTGPDFLRELEPSWARFSWP